jgi:hypothetical protein
VFSVKEIVKQFNISSGIVSSQSRFGTQSSKVSAQRSGGQLASGPFWVNGRTIIRARSKVKQFLKGSGNPSLNSFCGNYGWQGIVLSSKTRELSSPLLPQER